VLSSGEGPRTVPLPPAPTPDFNTSTLRVLDDGTLVVVSQEASRLRAIVSRDEGRHWSRPVDVTAPGVTSVATWAVASRGHAVSLSYLAQHRGDARFYGYVGLLPDPRTLWTARGTTVVSGQVAKGPLLYGEGPTGPAVMGAGTVPVAPGVDVPFPPPFDIQVFGNDFIGAAIGPDGTPWGSFTQDCGPSPSAPACRANGGQTRGLVGRLVLR